MTSVLVPSYTQEAEVRETLKGVSDTCAEAELPEKGGLRRVESE